MNTKFFRAGLTVALALDLASTGVALALPRDSITVSNFNSALRPPNAGSVSLIPSGAYTVRYVRIQGTFAQIPGAPTTPRPDTQAILCTPIDSFIAPAQLSSPFAFGVSSVSSYTGPISVDLFLRTPAPIPVVSGGPFVIQALDTAPTSGEGPVARWTTLTVTLNDGPPTPTRNAGTLTPRRQPIPVPIAFSGTSWVKFELAEDVTSANGRYLDIDTIGSALTPVNDTVIALYDDAGFRLVIDDDSGANPVRQSLLSFGAGTRPAVGNSAAYAGQNGTLRAGVYWLAVRGWSNPIDAGGVGWNFPSGSNYVGTALVNIRTNTGSPASCPVDYDGDGTRAPADIFAFLNAYFGGCP